MSSARRALVIGAGFAGLCAARVLADAFERVTLVERDRLPQAPEDRAGIPQGRHVHALLARGLVELERLFPGFRARARDLGALEMDMGLEAAILRGFGWAPRQRFGVGLLLASRKLFESVARERCVATKNVEVLERTTVTGLSTLEAAGVRVNGVRVSGERGTATLEADLVVDASGRASKAAEWLRGIGREPPAETVVDGRWGYSTRWYQAPERLPEGWWWRAVVIEGRPPDILRGGVLIPVESGQWMVTLGGACGQYPPLTEDGFVAALRQLRSPLIADAVALARPISPIYGSRTMSNRLRHYERWPRPPLGFIAVGDAVCTFNPIYGQGMSTAALCARALEETLERANGDELPAVFFANQARAQRDAWILATGADLRLPGVAGKRPFATALAARYFDALLLSTRSDALVHQRFFEVLQMLQPVSSFFAAPIVARVLADAIRNRLAARRRSDAIPASPDPQIVAS